MPLDDRSFIMREACHLQRTDRTVVSRDVVLERGFQKKMYFCC